MRKIRRLGCVNSHPVVRVGRVRDSRNITFASTLFMYEHRRQIDHALVGALLYNNKVYNMTHHMTHQGRLTLLLLNVNDEPK